MAAGDIGEISSEVFEQYLLLEECALAAFSEYSVGTTGKGIPVIKVADFPKVVSQLEGFLKPSADVVKTYAISLAEELQKGEVSLLTCEDFKAYFNFLQERFRHLGVRVAVIGAGVSGLSCASLLANEGISCTVFEREDGAGGRLATHQVTDEDGNTNFQFDHGACCIQPKATVMLDLCKQWEAAGIVAPWRGRFGTYDCSLRRFIVKNDLDSRDRYVGMPGMSAVCKHLAEADQLELLTTTNAVLAEQLPGGKWTVKTGNGMVLGEFDAVVLSDKAMSHHFPLKTKIDAAPVPAGEHFPLDHERELADLQTLSTFVTMCALAEPLKAFLFSYANVLNSPVIGTLIKDSSKPGRDPGHDKETWVLQSTTDYAELFLSDHTIEDNQFDSDSEAGKKMLEAVKEEMMAEFAKILPDGVILPEVVFSKAVYWSTAFSEREDQESAGNRRARRSRVKSYIEPKGVLTNRESMIGFCGDYLGGDTGDGAEASVISGFMVAKQLFQYL